MASGPNSSYSYCLSSGLLGKILQSPLCGNKHQGKEGGTPVLWESIWGWQRQEHPIALSLWKTSTCSFSHCVASGSQARLCRGGATGCRAGCGYFNGSVAGLQTAPPAEGQGRKQALQGLCVGVLASGSAEAMLRSGHQSSLRHQRSHPRPGILTIALTGTRAAP